MHPNAVIACIVVALGPQLSDLRKPHRNILRDGLVRRCLSLLVGSANRVECLHVYYSNSHLFSLCVWSLAFEVAEILPIGWSKIFIDLFDRFEPSRSS